MSESNGQRRYFNLAGVVRDLEHASSPGATPEGRDLWARFVAIADEALAEALAADDGATDQGGSDLGDDADLGDEGLDDGVELPRGPGGDAASIAALRSELAGLASLLAAQQGPPRSVPCGTAPVDGTRMLPESRGKPRRTREQRVADAAAKAAADNRPKKASKRRAKTSKTRS